MSWIVGGGHTIANTAGWYRAVLTFWILIGLAWFAGGINALQNYMASSIDHIVDEASILFCFVSSNIICI